MKNLYKIHILFIIFLFILFTGCTKYVEIESKCKIKKENILYPQYTGDFHLFQKELLIYTEQLEAIMESCVLYNENDEYIYYKKKKNSVQQHKK